MCNFLLFLESYRERKVIEPTICFLFTSHSEYRSYNSRWQIYTVNYSRNSRFPKGSVSKYDPTDVIRLYDISVLIASPMVRHDWWYNENFYSYFIFYSVPLSKLVKIHFYLKIILANILIMYRNNYSNFYIFRLTN